jgi:hypothetical protein
MGICLNILRFPAVARFNVGRVRPSVLRTLLVAADLGKYYERTLKNLLRHFTKCLPLAIRNGHPILYKIM